jgi:protein-tyrosine phosphatase
LTQSLAEGFAEAHNGSVASVSQAPVLYQSSLTAGDFRAASRIRGLLVIDIHCHPLPAIDDGAESLEESVAMMRMAAEDGITHTVATPHCNYRYKFDPEVNRQKAAELQAAVGDAPKMLLGCDFHLSYENVQQLQNSRADFTINGSSYVLVEFAEHFIPRQFEQVLYDLEVAGLKPIVTHPERNPVFQARPDLVYEWASRGCLIQVTAQSYVGGFGSRAESLAQRWLDQNLVHFFATDAHDTKHRPPLLSPCYERVAAAHGRETADRLLIRNPEAVINDKPLPEGPQPIDSREKGHKRGWLSFFTSRKRRRVTASHATE